MFHKETCIQTHLDNTFEIPEESVIKSIAENALKLKQANLSVDTVTNITVRHIEHPVNDGIIMDFLVKVSSSDDYFPVSVLIKKVTTSSSSIELQAYSTLFKDLQPVTMLNQRGNLYSLIPRPFMTQKQTIFLENLASSGFHSVERKSLFSLDFSHCLLAVETLAKFHASSYFLRRQLGLKGKGKLEMLQKYPFLSQGASAYSQKQHSKLGVIYENAFELACKLIESENPSLAFKLRRKVDPASVFDKVVTLLEDEKYENDDFYVVCHGNFHSENLLFKYDRNEPIECRISNLDSIFFGPLASDLALFLLTCTNFKFRSEFEEKLLAFYCDAFEEQLLARYNSNPLPDFDIEEFHRKLERQYMKMLEFGFYNACILLPIMLFQYNNPVNKFKGNEVHSIPNLLQENCLSTLFVNRDKGSEFENFMLNSSFLKERLVEILKQLAKCRVLL
ncbi:unnamed protein product [Orchesella dallaii]|uniref:CHK kinase-like domain-containing protein n=1 Tax=Orchesella dallaii TaxID=48710 RepID=A0ABP1RZY4_9HEXA